MNLDKKSYAIFNTSTNTYVDVSSNVNRTVFNPHIIAESIEEITRLHALAIMNSPYEEFKIVELTVITNDVEIPYNKAKIFRDISIKFRDINQKSVVNLETMLSYDDRYLLFLKAPKFKEASLEFKLNQIFWFGYESKNNIYVSRTNDVKYLTMLKLLDNGVLECIYDVEELKWL